MLVKTLLWRGSHTPEDVPKWAKVRGKLSFELKEAGIQYRCDTCESYGASQVCSRCGGQEGEPVFRSSVSLTDASQATLNAVLVDHDRHLQQLCGVPPRHEDAPSFFASRIYHSFHNKLVSCYVMHVRGTVPAFKIVKLSHLRR